MSEPSKRYNFGLARAARSSKQTALQRAISSMREVLAGLEIIQKESKATDEKVKTMAERIIELEEDGAKKDEIILKLKTGELRAWSCKMVNLLSRMRDLEVLATLGQICEIRQTEIEETPGIDDGMKILHNLFQIVPELEQMLRTYPEDAEGKLNQEPQSIGGVDNSPILMQSTSKFTQ